MLNHDHGIAAVHEFLQNVNQAVHVGGVQAGSRLVQNVNRAPCCAAGKLSRELHALCLAAGKRGCRLTEFDVAQAHVINRFQLAVDFRNRLEELHRLFDGHFEHVVNRLALVFDLERFSVEARALTDVAGHINIGKEMHFDFHNAVALTGFTAPAFDVEREPARGKAAHFRVLGLGEQVADIGKHAGVSRGVRPRGAAYGRLVNIDNLVEVFKP